MSGICPTGNRGLLIDLETYRPLLLGDGSMSFLDPTRQNVIRCCGMENYLAAISPLDGKTQALISHVIDGREVAHRSRPLTGQPISEDCLSRFESDMKSWYRLTTHPTVDPVTAQTIRGLHFPDPEVNPELYRVYGSHNSQRLLVIWGCERTPGTAILPSEAIAKLRRHSQRPQRFPFRRLLWVLAALLLLLLLSLMIPWNSSTSQEVPSEAPTLPATNQASATDTDRSQAVIKPTPNDRLENGQVPSTPEPDLRPTGSESPVNENSDSNDPLSREDGSKFSPNEPICPPARIESRIERTINSPRSPTSPTGSKEIPFDIHCEDIGNQVQLTATIDEETIKSVKWVIDGNPMDKKTSILKINRSGMDRSLSVTVTTTDGRSLAYQGTLRSSSTLTPVRR